MFSRKFLNLLGASCACVFLAALGSSVNTQSAPQNIVFVSYHTSEDTPDPAAATWFEDAPDAEYTRLLRAAGHNVTRYLTTAAPDVAKLNTNDLIIISRSVPSGNYQTDPSPALWNGITKPTILLGGYILRDSRLGYTYGGTMADASEAELRLTVNDPAHPIFTGITVDAANGNLMVNPYSRRITVSAGLQLGISVNTDEPVTGSTVLATVGAGTPLGGMVIGEFPAQTVMNDTATFNAQGTNSIAPAKRLVFLTGSRETGGVTVQGSGAFDLTVDGARMFLNAVHYMTGQPVTEPPPLISNIRPSTGTKEHLADLGLSFQASSGTAAGIPVENITLTLNGTNVPASQLTVTGTPQGRTVSFSNLVVNVQYTGTITVRDAGGREATANFAFDTLDPVALPTTFAFPTSAAVPASAGMRARIVQGPVTPIFANTEARAESQLAGTLINPDTGAPYDNEAQPSTDNPDGSYNIDIVNWSVEAGGTERGSFQAPNFPDVMIPGIVNHNFNVAAEILTYLELQPGRYYMGVNSDDGFAVYAGPNARDLFAIDLGRFDGGRGPNDTIFQFRVTQAGLYPFRLVYYQGDGGAALEWFTLNPLTGEKILINDPANVSAINAYRQINVGERPFVSSISPTENAIDIPVDAPIVIKVEEPGATIQANTIQLTVNGQTVTPQVAKAGTTTTITYDPAQNLPSETTIPVVLTFTDSASSQRTANFSFTTEFVPPVIEGANIAWVSFHAADDQPSAAAATAGFTNAPDVEYTRLLTNAGHTVTRFVTTGTPDIDQLRTFDLVIISRSNPSGNFQSAESTALWHSLTNPTIHLGGYALRANRLGFYRGDTIPDTTSDSVRLNVKAPNHPIFEGIDLDGSSNMVSAYAHSVVWEGNGARQRGISVNNNPVAPGGTVLATVATAGDGALNGTVISEFPAGTTMVNASSNVTAGHRLIFLTGTRENAAVGAIPALTGDGSGMYDLDIDGAKMFLNAVAYMAGLTEPEPTSVMLTATRNASGELVITWAEEGSSGYVLQATDTLSTPNWQPVGGTPTASNGTLSQTVPTTGTARFFRLARP